LSEDKKILVIGYGNPAREDDGLGPAAADAVAGMKLKNVTVDSDYQLMVEDAADVAKHDAVVFIDADIAGREPFSFKRVKPGSSMSFSTHSATPEGVVSLAQELFHAKCEAYILGIRGYSFEMYTETCTKKARENLKEALGFLKLILESGGLAEAVTKVQCKTTGNRSIT